ncbi:MAG: ROK family protein [Syntrophobacteraceae bacterium]|nr:ROK family protein [Syntrophobacteraceae bacterium]
MENQKKIACIGIDLGGTNLRAALVSRSGKILEMRVAKSAGQGAESLAKDLANQCLDLMRRGEAQGLKTVAAGLGVAGKIDPSGGLVVFSPNLPLLNGYPLGRDLEKNLGIPVYMENDANVFGLGESLAGAARGLGNWVGIVLGTGTGGCLFFNGKLWEGDRLGFSGEIGHMMVEPGGPICPCGSNGCLEAFASARALVSGAKRALLSPGVNAGPLGSFSGSLSAEAIYECAKRGDPAALALFDKMGWALGIALSNLFSALGIRSAVIGGGVSGAWDQFIGPLEKTLARNCSMLKPEAAIVRRSFLGDSAALIGAARLGFKAR